jgi:transcriptional regulator GlxA family with amidase domain
MLYSTDALVQRALHYMRVHLTKPFNVEQLAEHVGVSKRTLETRFRNSLRSSPHDFLTRLRVQHAQALMQLPQKRTLEQAARECGFGTVRALNKVFHRVAGESPSSYRKKLRVAGATRS